jgi:hypothetical protein
MHRLIGVLVVLAPLAARADDVALGVNASLGGKRVFPVDDAWNTDVSKMPVDASSDKWIASIGGGYAPLHPDFGARLQGKPYGIPYVVVGPDTPRTVVQFEYADESDGGYYPIPADAPVEDSGDRHILIVERDAWKLYELYAAEKKGGRWTAGAGAIFDLGAGTTRPLGWTSADAAGLPVFPGLVRHDEVVERKAIEHALRFTVKRTRRAFVWPARHAASRSTDTALPPLGIRLRLKAGVDVSGYPPQARVILTALKRYGMFLADNGGDLYLSGTPDARWDDGQLETLKRVRASDFEVVETGNITAP